MVPGLERGLDNFHRDADGLDCLAADIDTLQRSDSLERASLDEDSVVPRIIMLRSTADL